MAGLELPATMEQFAPLMDFIRREAATAGFSGEATGRIVLASEEIIVNIIRYAYPGDSQGTISISCQADEEKLTIVIVDAGVPFDPLAQERPDLDGSLEERSIGGLGIFMASRFMDEMHYRYANGCNHLTMIKRRADSSPGDQTRSSDVARA
jgi:serine/threonine-protein kinase RsbW